MVTHPAKTIAMLVLLRGLLVLLPISTMKVMPESDWFWRGLLAVFFLTFAAELFISFRCFKGRKLALAVGGSVGFIVIGVPIIFFGAFLLSLMAGTFVFPPR